MKKRGISAIVAVVMTILITVAAVVILWNTVVPMVRTELAFQDAGLVSVVVSDGWTFCDYDQDIVFVQVKQAAGDANVEKVKLILSYKGKIYSQIEDAPGPNNMRTYAFDISAMNVDYCNFDYVSVVPIIKGDEGPMAGKQDVPLGREPTIPIIPIELTDCGDLDVVDGAYILMNDIPDAVDDCFNILEDGISLDLGGHTVVDIGGDFYFGVFVDGVSDITIENGALIDFDTGVFVQNSPSLILRNLNLSLGNYGFILEDSPQSVLSDLILGEVEMTGLLILNSSDSVVERIDINSEWGGGGIYVEYGEGYIIRDVVMNKIGFNGVDFLVSDSELNNITIVECGSEGINTYSDGNVFTDINITDCWDGINLHSSSNNVFTNVRACESIGLDFDCDTSSGNSGSGNIFSSISSCVDNSWPVLGVDYTDTC